jgi:hypothetical protein
MLIFCDLRAFGCLISGHTQLSLGFVAFLLRPAFGGRAPGGSAGVRDDRDRPGRRRRTARREAGRDPVVGRQAGDAEELLDAGERWVCRPAPGFAAVGGGGGGGDDDDDDDGRRSVRFAEAADHDAGPRRDARDPVELVGAVRVS